jgi:transposase-like protein
MKKSTTFLRLFIILHLGFHRLVIIAFLTIALTGQIVESSSGWVLTAETASVQGIGSKWQRRERPKRAERERRLDWAVGRAYGRQTWRGVVWRSGLLLLCWGGEGAVWLAGLPWVVWVWQLLAVVRPGWRHGYHWARQGERLLLVGGVGKVMAWAVSGGALWLVEQLGREPQTVLFVGLVGCVLCGGTEREVRLHTSRDEEGQPTHYRATLCGHFELMVAADDFFRRRLLILFLRLLDVPGEGRRSRRTREGRTPAVRQQALSAAYGVTQPEISRWEGYWQRGDWRRLLSLQSADVLTVELQARIVQVFAQFPWWGAEKVYGYLQEQGLAVTQRQVRQAAAESGWSQLRQELVKRYHLTAESIRVKDEWLVGQLLEQVQRLLALLETGQVRLTVEEVTMADLLTLAEEASLQPPPAVKALPWAVRLEQLLFGQWALIQDEQVRCLYCGSSQVARKSAQPRSKRYYDETGAIQEVAVYRYYCRNAACEKGSFTHLPPGLLPYSPYRLQSHLLALQLTMWARTTYRRGAAALDIAPATLYRWIAACGHQLLPVAALFGLVRSSGVVGVDEKYVLVPKNDQVAGKACTGHRRSMRRWMYVSVAVDCYTYDLLHIAIYPYRTKASSQAFLLALRAKGYQPRVVVTDLWPDYEPLIAAVFPKAIHHHCIFHALQAVHRTLRQQYGSDFGNSQPQLLALQQTIDAIFQTRTRRTACQRYQALLTRQEEILAQFPDTAPLFAFLRRHWPRLINGIESKTIPRTNNAAELVIRRFDQHYQNFCGFDSLESAQLFLAVFEKVYRFTPFSQDAQPHVRGQCPLQLAGYDISQIPMASICAGWSPDWSLKAEDALVPNL